MVAADGAARQGERAVEVVDTTASKGGRAIAAHDAVGQGQRALVQDAAAHARGEGRAGRRSVRDGQVRDVNSNTSVNREDAIRIGCAFAAHGNALA